MKKGKIEMKEMLFGDLEHGFFLHRDQLFFGMTHGRFTFPFPVVNGEIQKKR